MSFPPRYLKAAVYGANDGIITTFAVVAGVAGAGLSARIIIVLGIANMVADGLSMGIGDYLGEKSEQRMRKVAQKKYYQTGLWKTGLITIIAFNLAGALPLAPYFLKILGLPIPLEHQFILSIISTASALFIVGSLRTITTKGKWYINGFEMLSIGAIAATAAYGLGYLIENNIR